MDTLKKVNPMEFEVLKLYLQFYTYKQIADELKIKVSTVRSHLFTARQKFDFIFHVACQAQPGSREFFVNGKVVLESVAEEKHQLKLKL
jgi:hypothetical protein